jgi:hypothetical protein
MCSQHQLAFNVSSGVKKWWHHQIQAGHGDMKIWPGLQIKNSVEKSNVHLNVKMGNNCFLTWSLQYQIAFIASSGAISAAVTDSVGGMRCKAGRSQWVIIHLKEKSSCQNKNWKFNFSHLGSHPMFYMVVEHSADVAAGPDSFCGLRYQQHHGTVNLNETVKSYDRRKQSWVFAFLPCARSDCSHLFGRSVMVFPVRSSQFWIWGREGFEGGRPQTWCMIWYHRYNLVQYHIKEFTPLSHITIRQTPKLDVELQKLHLNYRSAVELLKL